MKNLTHKQSHLKKKAIRQANRLPLEKAEEKEFQHPASHARDMRKKKEEALINGLDQRIKRNVAKEGAKHSKRTGVNAVGEGSQPSHPINDDSRWKKIANKKAIEDKLLFSKHSIKPKHTDRKTANLKKGPR